MPTLTVAGILGFLAPLAIAAINQPWWPTKYRQAVALVVSLVLAVVALLATNAFAHTEPTIPGVLSIIFLVIGVAQAAYALIFKPSGVAGQVEHLIGPKNGRHESGTDIQA